MRQRLWLFLYFAIFWLVFQIVIRGLFLTYNHELTSQLTFSEIFRVFLNGLKMDVSMIGYFLMITGLVLTSSMFVQTRWIVYVLNTFTIVALTVSSLIVIVDLELYRHWGFRLNTTPLFYMGSEAMGSVEITTVINLLLFFAALLTVSLFAYDRLIVPKIKNLKEGKRRGAFVLLLVSAGMFLPIRGSFTVAPMNTGFVFFHKTKAFANHAAINVIWNFVYSLRKSANVEYPENFISRDVAVEKYKKLYPADTTQVRIWKDPKPNIILFILESFTADVIGPLGGMENISPNLNELCKDGILFTNFYASGDRTDKGIISILSGYPAQPQTSIIKYPAKTQRLPYVTHYVRNLGYQTSFAYGGDIDFANFRSYLTNCNFDHMTVDEDFPDELNQSKWGVHDHIVFEQAFQECDTASAPFFKTILSLSSHEPFDAPMVPLLEGKDEETLFLNSCHYTDRSIGDFITKAKTRPWWNNTVVIFVADHGHRHPGNKELSAKERFRIPLIMIGGAIEKPMRVDKYASQTDIANTLLGQLDKPNASFTFSKNIFSPQTQSFAAYFYNDGFGFVAPEKYLIYDNAGKLFLRKDGATEEDLMTSKAYEQILFTDYNKK